MYYKEEKALDQVIRIEVTGGKQIDECMIHIFNTMDEALMFIRLSKKSSDEELIYTIL